jgi:hypothetical protein
MHHFAITIRLRGNMGRVFWMLNVLIVTAYLAILLV